uniref:Long chain base biosynthesis protein 1-like n=1 Tax=Tanacetum cinerariifolium TaxID=118510 RepID=A0A6L2M6F2_TANCI|nr:long chain base biosynthesis protein 1-like [Tanacetum cinerariifolium]
MESLRSTLEKVTQDNKRAKKLRRYIMVESVYQTSGQIAPLDEIIRLKEKYRFRVLLVPIDKVDIITASMGHALASEGGFCTGSNRVIDHQVLKEHTVFVVTSKRSTLDKCKLPVGIGLFVSAAHTESDIQKAYESLKIVAASVLTDHN